MQYSELITHRDTFRALRDECSAVFDTQRRLPEYVFRQALTTYYVFEYGLIMRNEFATFLANVARRFGDSTVNYMTLDPDPEVYYYRNCGFYGLASFDPSTLTDNYMKVMSRDGNADSFRVRGGDVGVMWGSSLKWGIFCDRMSWELCLMASPSPLDDFMVENSRTVSYMNTNLLRNYVSNEYRHEPSVALEFLRDLAKNYPILR
jgi:hypothetical protein